MYTMSREIGIDSGHRVPTHGSKCRNLHGHRYHIQAICKAGILQEAGEQKDMVIDFGFLKEEMMNEIDTPCDHGLILFWGDELLETIVPDERTLNSACSTVKQAGYCSMPEPLLIRGVGKLYIIPEVPTAEVLAKHWYYRLKPRVVERSDGHARLSAVKVWETPNCWAVYREQTQESTHEATLEGR